MLYDFCLSSLPGLVSYYVGALEFLVIMLNEVTCYIFCLPRLPATNFAYQAYQGYQACQVQVLVTTITGLMSYVLVIGHKAVVSL